MRYKTLYNISRFYVNTNWLKTTRMYSFSNLINDMFLSEYVKNKFPKRRIKELQQYLLKIINIFTFLFL